jgi:hypothetical protein
VIRLDLAGRVFEPVGRVVEPERADGQLVLRQGSGPDPYDPVGQGLGLNGKAVRASYLK